MTIFTKCLLFAASLALFPVAAVADDEKHRRTEVSFQDDADDDDRVIHTSTRYVDGEPCPFEVKFVDGDRTYRTEYRTFYSDDWRFHDDMNYNYTKPAAAFRLSHEEQ